MTRRVVIVSTGRTGTRSIAEYLDSAHSDIDAFHITPWSTLFNVLSNAWLSGLISAPVLDSAWSILKHSQWQAHSERRTFVDSNNHLYALVRHLLVRYPDLSMIHVVRDPRSYVQSHLRWSRQRSKSWIANYIVPFWQPNAFLMGEAEMGEWWRMSTFERFCWIWDFKNRLIRDTGRQFPQRYLRISFESLTSPEASAEELGKMEKFIGVDDGTFSAPARLPQANQTACGHSVPSWHGLSDIQCRQLDRLCREQMNDYGYGREESWLARLP